MNSSGIGTGIRARDPTGSGPPEIAVIIATLRRPELVGRLLDRLERQTRIPTYVIVACTQASDLPQPPKELCEGRAFECVVCYSATGTCLQRNTAVHWLSTNTSLFKSFSPNAMLIFVDDDFVMRDDWIEKAAAEIQKDSAVVGLTGALLADGAENAGYTDSDASAILNAGEPLLSPEDWRRRPGHVESLYGCNMVVRAANMLAVEFDERLPLYGWLEDYDLCARLKRDGSLKLSESMIGVHLATKKGRTSGLRFGYSQVANPIYLARKGTMNGRFALQMLLQCIVSNALKSGRPESYIDRRGRLAGNFRALGDLLRRRLDPREILYL